MFSAKKRFRYADCRFIFVDKENKGLYNYFSFFGDVVIMHIYLPEIKDKDGAAVEYSFESDLADSFDDFSEGSTLQMQVSVSCSADKILISGSFKATINAVCSRCLVTFQHNLKTDFSDAFTIITEAPLESARGNLAAETANMQTVSGNYLYLDEYIRQLIILAQEYNPLCKTDCKGICAGCGADLNQATCSCNLDEDEVDIRLLKLKELKNNR